MVYTGVNLAPLPTGWVNDYTWVDVPASPNFQDTTTTHLGHYTVRIDPPPASGAHSTFDAIDFGKNGVGFIACTAGDHFYYSAWLKAGGTTPVNQEGAWLALDYYTGFGQTRINGMDTAYCAGIGQSWPQYNDPNKDNAFIHWGTDWTLVEWDWIVPTYALAQSDGSSQPIGSFIPWIQRQGTQGSIWISDVVIYKNPSGSPGSGSGALTFGKTVQGSTPDNGATTIKRACKFALLDSNVLVSSISWIGHLNAAAYMKFALYTDNSGVPGTLLGTTNPVQVGTTDSLVTADFSSYIGSLNAGNYWLAWVADNAVASTMYFYYDTGSTNQRARLTGTSYAAEYTNPFGTVSIYDTEAVSIYATYTKGSGNASLPWTDSFSDLSSWTIQKGSWSATSNILNGSATLEALVTAGNVAWTNYSVTVHTVINTGAATNQSDIVLRYVDGNNYYYMGVGSFGHQYSIAKVVNGVESEIASSGSISSITQNTSYKIKGTVNGNVLTLFVNDTQVLQITDNSLTAGALGVRTYASSIQILDITAAATSAIAYVTSVTDAIGVKDTVTTKATVNVTDTIGLNDFITRAVTLLKSDQLAYSYFQKKVNDIISIITS
jgi:hypothetical protein